jgi:long-chain acyl-CoA synthetase
MVFQPKFPTIVDLLESSVSSFGPRNLFGSKEHGAWTWVSYQEFKTRVDTVRAGLAALGVKKGDHVALIANNQLRWALASYACMGLGAVLVPMYESQLEKDWQFIIKDCQASLLLVSNQEIYFKTKSYPETIPCLKQVIQLNAPASSQHSFDRLLTEFRNKPLAPVYPDQNDTAFLIYTSGTTGIPKGVPLSHINIASNVSGLIEVFDLRPADMSLSFLPWAHCFGLTAELHCMVALGASVAINSSTDKLLDELVEVRPTVLMSVPRIFNRIYEGVNRQIAKRPAPIQRLFHEGLRISAKLRSESKISIVEKATLALANRLVFSVIRDKFGGQLRYAISGGAALSHEVAQFIDSLDITVYEGYGLTETSPVIAVNSPGCRRLGSVGKPLPGCSVRIDKEATEDPSHGEIVTYGPNVFHGYHARPDEDRNTLLPDGGFRTGDMGYLDSDGYLFITGRLKEQYKLENGKYVVPAPLEETITLSPFIACAYVHGHDRPYNVALIVPNFDQLGAWAKDNGIAETIPEHLVKDSRVISKIQEELDRAGEDYKGFERVRKFALLTEEFTTQNGLLTPKLSLKRAKIVERYASTIDNLYKS